MGSTWAPLLLQLAFPFVLFFGRPLARRVALIAAMSFHLGILLLMGLSTATRHHIWDFSRRNCDPFGIIEDLEIRAARQQTARCPCRLLLDDSMTIEFAAPWWPPGTFDCFQS